MTIEEHIERAETILLDIEKDAVEQFPAGRAGAAVARAHIELARLLIQTQVPVMVAPGLEPAQRPGLQIFPEDDVLAGEDLPDGWRNASYAEIQNAAAGGGLIPSRAIDTLADAGVQILVRTR